MIIKCHSSQGQNHINVFARCFPSFWALAVILSLTWSVELSLCLNRYSLFIWIFLLMSACLKCLTLFFFLTRTQIIWGLVTSLGSSHNKIRIKLNSNYKAISPNVESEQSQNFWRGADAVHENDQSSKEQQACIQSESRYGIPFSLVFKFLWWRGLFQYISYRLNFFFIKYFKIDEGFWNYWIINIFSFPYSNKSKTDRLLPNFLTCFSFHYCNFIH